MICPGIHCTVRSGRYGILKAYVSDIFRNTLYSMDRYTLYCGVYDKWYFINICHVKSSLKGQRGVARIHGCLPDILGIHFTIGFIRNGM